MSNVIVVGGGAAGMMAAVFAARNGQNVQLLEKNEKLGKKLFITGKGRCNITNAADIEDLFTAVISNPKFLYSGFYSFTNQQVIDFFEELGVKTKIERGERVFPVSDHSSDVIAAFSRELKSLGVSVSLHTEVRELLCEQDKVCGVLLTNGKKMKADAVIVATGGISYPSTGSTGDGYRFAKETGHRVTELLPSLVPMEVRQWYAKELQGLSLRNIEICITDGKKKLYEEFGEMLFTHYGVTGPVILSASSVVGKTLRKKELTLHIDLKPALSEEQLDKRILREFDANHNKQYKNSIDSLFPAKLKPVMIELSEIEPEKKVNEITKEERQRLVHLIKDFTMTLTGLRSYNEAIITKGGVSVKEVDPGTMESKKMKGLYFAGEVLDLDAVTGGYNLQIAWSTGYLAGMNAGCD
ncbi:NAD(P)/FAD-dependent oxidoreductase [Mediterraneibacter faecis]|jgi:predicted Rossmann fold flavoprotein|uniref:NAD(P)/FAD-dependent oxidoreductase n=1 Tax=Mediterraneibacter faecis TaxID=592978 RepID=UPI000E4001F6|nr:NAD(P)/FAD-dependent oxidoreductase [Mediterraneibacter faecis]RGF08730.1 NAD(P)/FAD-dependent oxidoreductase [Ruminococcus sp. AM22-14LB]RGG56027.1 NAD(P)/FAD-dependent oxidoreductase [Ruminococcus sp. AF19-4LB]RGH72529.1 NAD(P)/FAD-dependent oxidoreductase [Ruminococcus sp. AM29-5AC]RGH76357.1 NAD(P)/FAD-dependent oxidoreductase [Ruminococcus sp. AM29-1LB]RGH78310.1 NAD(P)/FAD-dependent oxidoreductase [Ruminococcus sp. AM29-19LB]RGH81171.1 NAD(P)/FAD-dependent oxidoreductase [Ruminococcu